MRALRRDDGLHLGRGRRPVQRLLDGRGVGGAGKRGAVGGMEDELGAGPPGCGEVPLHLVKSGLGLRAGNGERVVELAARGLGAERPGDDHQQPDRDHQPSVREARAPDPVQDFRHPEHPFRNRRSRSFGRNLRHSCQCCFAGCAEAASPCRRRWPAPMSPSASGRPSPCLPSGGPGGPCGAPDVSSAVSPCVMRAPPWSQRRRQRRAVRL